MKRVKCFKELAGLGFVGRAGANEVAFKGPRIGVENRNPRRHEIAKGFGHAVDMAGPGEAKTIGIVETTLVFGEPARQRAIVQNSPNLNAGVSSSPQDV
ncbi:unannotated protein [freshwater metagenome]|uniref:Unannotated protein n=1 Tax=freshwater metagenome TaxID=449393 RepID=A0A6J6CGS9_9ZZZZ